MKRRWFGPFLAFLSLGVGFASEAKTVPPSSRTPGDPPHAIVPDVPTPPLMKLADVKPGMKGHALTVFKGTKPEPFDIKVVAVLKQFLPKQDVILIRAEDPRVEHSGIVAGMSGSPVYIDGKLVGAIAYAWAFDKEPLGGVTPIESMLAERNRPRRRSPDKPELAQADTVAQPGEPRGLPALASSGNSGPMGSDPRLVRASVPLSLSGFTARSVADLTEELRPMGMVPIQGGGGGRVLGANAGPGRVEPGSAIGVELVRGDMSMVGTGTVTWTDGQTVLAFGHPMFGIGEVYLPMVDAEIHTFLPSLAQSFKMSSPLHEVGVLVQDRNSCIVGSLEGFTSMMPVSVRVTGPEGNSRTFNAEVARNRRLTPLLASTVVGNALTEAEPDVTDMVATVSAKLTMKGRPPLEFRDQLFSSEGISGRGLGGSHGMRALGDLLFNPFEPVIVEKLDVDVRVEFKRDVAEIVGMTLPSQTLSAGETIPVRVTLRPYAGKEYVETVKVKIPELLAGQSVRIEAAAGNMVRPEMAPPENLAGYIDNLRKYYTASNIVVSVQASDEGVALRGNLIADLPASAMDTLRPAMQTRRADSFRLAERTVSNSKRLVAGRQELTVAVRDDAVGRGSSTGK